MRLFLLLTVLFWAGCSTASSTSEDGGLITLEGTLTMRGPEPDPVLVLETNQRNLYVLNLDAMQAEQQAEALGPTTPLRARITGMLYRDQWNGRPYAFVRVRTLQDLAGVERPE